MPISFPACIAEFVGTYVLVVTVGVNVVAGDPLWAATSNAAMLTAMIYAFGKVSGANFNPAVSVTLGLTGNMGFMEVCIYCAMQILGGGAAGCSFKYFLGKAVPLEPRKGFSLSDVIVVESIYTFVLCFVVLNCVASRRNGVSTGQQFYGLAIGFVIVAGGYAAGNISGGMFNPAVAAGVIASGGGSITDLMYYICFEIIGGVVAAPLYCLVRPAEFGAATFSHHGTDISGDLSDKIHFAPGIMMVSECIGTFVLVFTASLNLLSGSLAGAWSISASIMSMVFSLRQCSGAHFNPAVTFAIMLSGGGLCSLVDFVLYVPSQLIGALAGCFLATHVYSDTEGVKELTLGPIEPYHWDEALGGECFFTFVLCFVVLSVATVRRPLTQVLGLAIGLCVTAGGCALGGISGGCLNPAVAIGIKRFSTATLLYSVAEFVGAALAAVVFRLTHIEEYKQAQE